jgi:hypothetical protein
MCYMYTQWGSMSAHDHADRSKTRESVGSSHIHGPLHPPMRHNKRGPPRVFRNDSGAGIAPYWSIIWFITDCHSCGVSGFRSPLVVLSQGSPLPRPVCMIPSLGIYLVGIYHPPERRRTPHSDLTSLNLKVKMEGFRNSIVESGRYVVVIWDHPPRHTIEAFVMGPTCS